MVVCILEREHEESHGFPSRKKRFFPVIGSGSSNMKYTLVVALLGLVAANGQTAMRGTKVENDNKVEIDNEVDIDNKVEIDNVVDIDDKDIESEIFLPQGTKVRKCAGGGDQYSIEILNLFHLFIVDTAL